MKKYLVYIPILIVTFYSCSTFNADTQKPQQKIIHNASGLILYNDFGNWKFSGIHSFAEDDLDVAYSFDNLSESTLKGTYYVYPAGSDLSTDEFIAHYNEALMAALSYSKESQLVFSGTGNYSRDGNLYPSCFGTFDFQHNNEKMRSYLIIYYIKN